MCGIAGIIAKNSNNLNENHKDIVSNMINELRHRGPDALGFSQSNKHIFGHARLSIIDLKSSANQPMKSLNGRFEIVFNGEIYNYIELKEELISKGHKFLTDGDTEVILRLWEEYGEKSLIKLNGMFALVIYDSKKKTYFLARDRFGVKPLYVSSNKDHLFFCSEINPIVNTSKDWKINYQALSEYLHFGGSQGSKTFFKNIIQIDPGHIMIISPDSESNKKYASLPSSLDQTYIDKDLILDTLQNAVSIQNRADVKTGILLSGGIDSSAIACLLKRSGQEEINTFTAAFEYGNSNDERDLAKLVSEHIDSDHTEIFITSSDALGLVDKVIDSFDQPFGDPAVMPLLKLYEKISDHVKVILQGDGGDEIFGGYDRYVRGRIDNKFLKLLALNNEYLLNFLSKSKYINSNIIRNIKAFSQKNRADFVASYMDQDLPGFSINNCLSDEAKEAKINSNVYQVYNEIIDVDCNKLSYAASLIYADRKIILPNIYLPKVDRTSMQYSIEARVPFLDNELFSLMSSVSLDSLTAGGVTKSLLRDTLKGIVPNAILNGHKKGFGVPIGEWMKRDLGELLLELAPSCPLLNADIIKIELQKHRRGMANLGLSLYKLLILSCWYKRYQYKINL